VWASCGFLLCFRNLDDFLEFKVFYDVECFIREKVIMSIIYI
jgi:hypothetical protein